ncbi:hypothetical protein NQ314_005976 [Rhamnusium bicolor]|uniref:RNA polymerase II-associated protein 1 n=1 Tax=Rhamnusium bicolor TaxID=1586634 RepID=A0AAV8ZBV2_9CUCU|nr:hypothetical protein NQ314_005976 [Rhamnusium bicolor]
MYSRPKPGETEEDLLRLQGEFEKNKAENKVKPAATFVSERNNDENKKQPDNIGSDNFEIGEQLANTFEAIPSDIKLQSIIEKQIAPKNVSFKFNKGQGFPQAKRRDPNVSTGKGSIFAQQMKKIKKDEVPMDTEITKSILVIREKNENIPLSNITVKPNMRNEYLPSQSYILTGSDREQIHEENVNVLKNMSEQEILEEREKLLATMDPAIVAFLKSRRKNEIIESRTPTIKEQNDAAEDMDIEEIETPVELLTQPSAEKWLNFDTIETNKLAWMKSVDIPKIDKSKQFEARFDFEGWLLPYSEPEINEKNRILYHHGEDPGRPGYTLQELFQLSRSSVIQQKIIALNCIANILSLNSTGIYDDIIDIPIEQIFFVVRFCLDDNTPTVLNASIKAMRNLIFSQIDETCLDSLLGFALGHIQPVLAVDNEKEDDNTVNDQQLAERNIIKCLARTEILTRIRYIINTVKPSLETIVYCMDILIRMARDSELVLLKIFACEGLIESITKHFVPTVLNTNSSILEKSLADLRQDNEMKTNYIEKMKKDKELFMADVSTCEEEMNEIIRTQKLKIAELNNYIKILEDTVNTLQDKEIKTVGTQTKNTNVDLTIQQFKILDSILMCLSNDTFSSNVNGLKLQTECMHLWTLLINYGLSLDYFSIFQSTLLSLLDYHFKNTNLDMKTTFVRQGHLAALLILLGYVGKINYTLIVPFLPLFAQCLLKWSTQFTNLNSFACGKLQIISAVIYCLSCIREYQQVDVDKTILFIINSKGYQEITNNIRRGSMLLNNYETHKSSSNLKSLEAAAWHTMDHIVPLMQTNSCLPFLYSLSHYVNTTDKTEVKMAFLRHANIQRYLEELQELDKYHLTSNWFTRPESLILMNILKSSVSVKNDLDTSTFYELSVKCLSVFNAEQKADIEYLLEKIIFSPKFYPNDVLLRNLNISQRSDSLEISLSNLEDIMKVYTQVLGLKNVRNVIPIDWIYTPILVLYANQQQNKVNIDEQQQIFTIRNCLRWILIYETYFPVLASTINPTDKFCRLACVFLGSDSLFLTKEIHDLLEHCFKNVITKCENELNFKKDIQGLTNFQDFYTQLLEQYQGVSYGDILFGNVILVPLAQKHNIQYKKTLWSEYMGAVQIFNVTPEQCICNLELFLNPSEADMSLLTCYRRAVINNLARKDSVLYQIAKHHVDMFISKSKRNKRS